MAPQGVAPHGDVSAKLTCFPFLLPLRLGYIDAIFCSPIGENMTKYIIHLEVAEEYRWLPCFRETGRTILRLISECTAHDALKWAHRVYPEAHKIHVEVRNV